jgi:hypothetical protein
VFVSILFPRRVLRCSQALPCPCLCNDVLHCIWLNSSFTLTSFFDLPHAQLELGSAAPQSRCFPVFVVLMSSCLVLPLSCLVASSIPISIVFIAPLYLARFFLGTDEGRFFPSLFLCLLPGTPTWPSASACRVQLRVLRLITIQTRRCASSNHHSWSSMVSFLFLSCVGLYCIDLGFWSWCFCLWSFWSLFFGSFWSLHLGLWSFWSLDFGLLGVWSLFFSLILAFIFGLWPFVVTLVLVSRSLALGLLLLVSCSLALFVSSSWSLVFSLSI